MQTRLRIVCLMALITSHLAAADRIEVVADFAGKRVPGARACFSRALVEQSRASTVVEQLVSGPETRCLPADAVMSLPVGSWHLYVVADNPFLISTHPTSFQSAASSDDGDIPRVLSHLVPAATVDLREPTKKLAAGESLALYITNIGSDGSGPSLLPVSTGVEVMPVPARTPVVPLILRGTTIVAVGARITVEPGKTAVAAFPVREDALVVVPFEFVSDVDAAPPKIHVMHRRLNKVVAQYKLAVTEKRGLMFAETIERGKVNVLVDSATFSANPLEIVVGAHAAGQVVTSGDLRFKAGVPRRKITWEIDGQFANDVSARADCAGSTDSYDAPSLSLFACKDPKPVTRFRDLDRCTLLRQTALAVSNERAGAVEWAVSTESTNAVAVITYGGISAFESVNPMRKSGTDVVRLMPRSITGRVTLRDEPVIADVGCGGPTLMTDAAGYYRCWRPVIALPIVYVMPCDGSGGYQQTFSEDATVVDVRIATNTLVVKVADSAGTPIQNAYVRLLDGSPFQEPEPASMLLGLTSETGGREHLASRTA